MVGHKGVSLTFRVKCDIIDMLCWKNTPPLRRRIFVIFELKRDVMCLRQSRDR